MKKTLLFTIIMALLCLASPMSAQTSVGTTNGELNFQRPAEAWLWTGSGSDNRWDNSANWTKPNGNTQDFPGQTNDKDLVFIPTSPAGSKFPSLDAKITISKIYLAKGAMLEGQYNLVATDGWYTDIVIPANRYVMLSSPLKQTYMGDFFTATQGGTYVGPFSPAVYDAIDGNTNDGGHNRKFPYSIYQRLFASAVDVLYDAYTLHYYDAAWSTPTNVMNYEYQVGEGFQVLARADQSSEMADFHLPSEATEYFYYKNDGTRSDISEQTSRSNAGKPAYDAANLTVTLRRSQASDNVLWAAGNPAFATMKIREFLEENYRAGYTGCYLYKHINGDGTPSNASGSDVLYYYNNATGQLIENQSVGTQTSITSSPYIERNSGFTVESGNGQVQPNYPTDLLGTYEMTLTPASIDWRLRSPWGGFIGLVERTSGTNTTLRQSNSNITISKHPSNNNKVFISNLAGIATQNIEGTVTMNQDGNGGIITIDPGCIVGTYNGWTGSNASSTNMAIYAANSGTRNITLHGSQYSETITSDARSNVNIAEYSVESQYADNVSKDNSLILGFSIASDGSIAIQANNAFALYPESSKTKYFYVGSVYHSSWISSEYGIGNFFSSTWNAFNTYTGSKAASGSQGGGTSTGTSSNMLTLMFTPNMFTTSTTAAQSAPRKTAAHGGNTISIVANYNNRTVNTFFVRNNEATNGFNSAEDAPIIGEFDEDVFSIGTLAGATRVAVNAINDTTRAQIVLTGVNGEVELVFDNLEALGENVRLFDANDSTERPLNGNHDNVTVNFGVNDSPLRYSLVWDYAPIISGNETLVDLDFTVFSPAKGEVKVMSGDIMNNVRLYNAAGQLVKSIAANSNDASFSALLPGIYVVEIYTRNGRGTKKVDVK